MPIFKSNPPDQLGLAVCVLVLILVSWCDSRPSWLVLYKEDGTKMELNSRQCKAGIFLPDYIDFDCACVSGVWGFYGKFCKAPELIIGGHGPCFLLKNISRISQVIPFGSRLYPFLPAITHFTEDFKIMTRTLTTDSHDTEIEIPAIFLTVTGVAWTLKGDTGQEVCLQSSFPANETEVYCLYQVNSSQVESWLLVRSMRRGCHAQVILQPDSCYSMLPKSDECEDLLLSRQVSTVDDITETTDEGSTEPSTSTTTELISVSSNNTDAPTSTTPLDETSPNSTISTEETTLESTTENATTTTELPTTPSSIQTTTEATSATCQKGIEREDVKEHWPARATMPTMCSRVLSEVTLVDSLRRFATLKMQVLHRSRQNSLHQMEKIFEIHAQLMKTTCSSRALPPIFVDSVMLAFTWLVNDDFFYGVEEFEADLFERTMYALRTCVHAAETFQFVEQPAPCNTTKLLPIVILDGQELPVMVPSAESWQNFEPLIESSWKMFLNAHSYCYKYFYRQNDHHSYSLKLMQIFSNTIFDKWKMEMRAKDLYKLFVPYVEIMEQILDNQDLCVAAVSHVSTCPVWMDRSSTRRAGLGKRKKRSIWTGYFRRNRGDAVMWGGKGFCLRSPDDPSYYLGFGRCAHP